MLVFASFALGADLSRYPVCAEVRLPQTGPVRVTLPLSMRIGGDPRDGSGVILLDRAERHVPTFRLSEQDEPPLIAVTAEPTDIPRHFTVDVGPAPVEALLVALPNGLPPVRVTARQGSNILAASTLVWRLPGTSNAEVPLPPVSGRIEVALDPIQGSSIGDGPTFRARPRTIHVSGHTFELALTPPVVLPDGRSRSEILLPEPLVVDKITVHAQDPVFSRNASFLPVLWGGPDTQQLELEATTPQTIARVHIGELSVESATIRNTVPRDSRTATDRIALLVDDAGLPSLDLTGVTAYVAGAELVAIDAGEGPHRLCGGAVAGSTPVADFGAQIHEIAALAGEPVTVGAVTDNPLWQPPEQRGDLAMPGRPFDERAFRWRRSLSSPLGAGLVRVVLPHDLVADLRPDLGDLRVVSEGRLVPHLLRELPTATLLEGLSTERSEHDGYSRIRIGLPHRGLQIKQLVLHTDASIFSRSVEIARPDSGSFETLRYVEWIGDGAPRPLAIALDQPVDREIVVDIRNGDDPPLPITDIEVQVAGFELMTVIPDAGADLVGGSAATASPDYDLAAIGADLFRRSSAVGVLGPPESIRKRALGTLDRTLLAVGIGVFALSLALLLLDLVYAIPQTKGPARPAETGEAG